MRLFSILIIAAMTFLSCGKDQIDIDRQLILDYIAENNLDMDETPEGIFYSIDSLGSGDNPSYNSFVTMDYKGYYLDGTVFDQSKVNDPLKYNLNNLIEGWIIGVQLFRRGDSGTLIIPSRYAYGSSGYASIPGNTVLAFDITLLDF